MKKLIILSLFSIFIFCGCNNKEEKQVEPKNIEIKDNQDIELEPKVEPIEPKKTTKKMYVSAKNGLNIRKYADKNSEKIDTVPVNTELEVVDNFFMNDWYMIIYKGKECYVYKYLSENKVEVRIKKVNNNISSKSKSTNSNFLGRFKITHYCPNYCCSTENGVTASGETARPYQTVAMKGISFGTKISINGKVYIVQDRGVGSGVIDICVGSHEEALKKGVYYADVYVIN